MLGIEETGKIRMRLFNLKCTRNFLLSLFFISSQFHFFHFENLQYLNKLEVRKIKDLDKDKRIFINIHKPTDIRYRTLSFLILIFIFSSLAPSTLVQLNIYSVKHLPGQFLKTQLVFYFEREMTFSLIGKHYFFKFIMKNQHEQLPR